ncbi:MAG: branched-chain amino acid ABC transporter permease [Candidatus Liptonbacteria bacterium]|nr:branched-chain amino acid ABC transporter permease [Candidatus Liptonbacteria bacterium]
MPYLVHILILFCIYAIIGISLNLVVGYTGLISIAHAVFSTIGGYAVAILMTFYGWNFFLAMLVGVLVSACVAWPIAWLLSRLTWDYYVLGTVGFNYVIYVVFLNWESLTRGPLGIPGIPRPTLGPLNFTSNYYFLILALLFATAAYLFARYLVRTSFGRVLKAIREDEQALRVFGYETTRYKVAIFVIAAMLAAMAGALAASFLRFLDPTAAALMDSIFAVSIVILGGVANLEGSILGALVLVAFPELMRFVGFSEDIAGQMRQLFYGLLLIIMMRWRPQGLMGEYKL